MRNLNNCIGHDESMVQIMAAPDFMDKLKMVKLEMIQNMESVSTRRKQKSKNKNKKLSFFENLKSSVCFASEA